MITNTTKNDPIVNLLTNIVSQEAQGQRELVKSSQLPAKGGMYSNKDAKALYESLGIKVIGESKNDSMFLDVILPEGWKKTSTDHHLYTQLVDERARARLTFFYKAAYYDREAFIYGVETRFTYHVIDYLSEEERGHYETEKIKVALQEVDIEGYYGRFEFKTQRVWVPKYQDWYIEQNHTKMYFEIYDSGILIYKSEPVFFKNKYHEKYHRYWHKKFDTFKNFLRKNAITYLDQKYPDWNNYLKHWD
jgi:hypothetical protein